MSQDFIPGEPPNRIQEEHVNLLDPPPSLTNGEDNRRSRQIFLDTGGTMTDFARSSEHVARFLKKT